MRAKVVRRIGRFRSERLVRVRHGRMRGVVISFAAQRRGGLRVGRVLVGRIRRLHGRRQMPRTCFGRERGAERRWGLRGSMDGISRVGTRRSVLERVRALRSRRGLEKMGFPVSIDRRCWHSGMSGVRGLRKRWRTMLRIVGFRLRLQGFLYGREVLSARLRSLLLVTGRPARLWRRGNRRRGI